MLLAQFLTKASEGDQFEFFTTGLYDEEEEDHGTKKRISCQLGLACGTSTEGKDILLV